MAKTGVLGAEPLGEGVRGRRREIPAFAGMTFGWSQGDSSPSILKKMHFSRKTANCHILTFAIRIFIRARFYADDIPYRIGTFGPFRGRRCGRRMRHYPTAEDCAVPDYRGDCGVVRVLRRVKRSFPTLFFCQKCCQKGLYYTTFLATFWLYL